MEKGENDTYYILLGTIEDTSTRSMDINKPNQADVFMKITNLARNPNTQSLIFILFPNFAHFGSYEFIRMWTLPL